MENPISTTIKSMNLAKKTAIFKIIVDNKEKYTTNRNGIFIDYLKLSEKSQKAIISIINRVINTGWIIV
jgi:hypothetical protein